MVLKTKLEVAGDSAAFVAFYDLFQKYRSAFEDTPEAWKQVADATGRSRQNFEQTANSLRGLADQMDRVMRRGTEFAEVSDRTSRHWHQLAINTKTVAGNIVEATTSLLKWAGITSLVTGLVGGGTLYGLDRMAGAVGNQRTNALGLGTSYGALSSFEVNFGRLGNPTSILAAVNEAQHNRSKSQGLYAMLPEGEQRGDSAEVAVKWLDALKQRLDRTPDRQVGNVLQATHAGDYVGLDQALRLKGMSRQEFDQLRQGFKQDQKGLGLSGQDQKAWQDFSTQMERAGKEIENTFVTGLVNLEPGLNDLSTAVTDLTGVLLAENGPVSHWLDELNHGLEWLATNMDTPEFKQDVENFIADVGKLAEGAFELSKAVVKTLHWFGVMAGSQSAQDAAAGASGMVRPPPPTGGAVSPGTRSGGGTPGRGGGGSTSPNPGGSSGSGSSVGTGGSSTDGFNVRGVKNMNPGNIAWGPWAKDHGATGWSGTDQDHGVAVFPSYESGLRATDDLAASKYGKGRHSANDLIAGQGGWTPGNKEAAANIARSMGIGPDDDMHLDDPSHMKSFHSALMKQELGPKGAAYYEGQLKKPQTGTKVTINRNVGGNPIATSNAISAQ